MCLPSCNGLHDYILIELVAFQLAYNVPVAHDDEPLADGKHFLNFGGNERNAHAFFCQFEHLLLDFQFGADVNAARRFIKDKVLRVRKQPARKDNFLLVSAGKRLDGRFLGSGFYFQQLDVFVGKLF